MAWWYACQRKQEDWPAVPKNHAQIVALDAAVSGDCFGITMGCRHPEIHNEILTQFVQKWKPGLDGKINFQGTEENPGPELVLRKLIKDYNIIEVAYDPNQLHDMATRLSQEGLAWFHPFNQGNERLVADQGLLDLIRDRRIWHRGEPDLADHIQNADAQIDKEDRKLRLVKRAEKLKIDLAVCESMMCHELMRLNL
jgi:hypothetical protein